MRMHDKTVFQLELLMSNFFTFIILNDLHAYNYRALVLDILFFMFTNYEL